MSRVRAHRPASALLFPIGVLTALGAVGTALTPTLAARHPLLLIMLEARDRNLLLARHVGVALFVVTGSLRRLAADPFFYLLGRRHGDAGVQWLERHGGGRVLRTTVRAFRRAAYPMLVVFPGAVVCTLAGDAGIPPAAFTTVIVLRTVAMVLLIKFMGDVFAGPIDATVHFFDAHAAMLTLCTVGAVVGWVLWNRRRGDSAPLRPMSDA